MILDFGRFEEQTSDFSQLVRQTSNGAFCVSYAISSLTCKFELNTTRISNDAFCVISAESRLTCKFELKTVILDFGRIEVGKNPIFNNSSR